MSNQQAAKDDNDVSSLLVVSSVDGTTMKVKGNPVTGAMLVDTSGGFINPMTTTGDMIYSSDNLGTPARRGIGSSGQVLTVSGGIPIWTTPAGTGLTIGTTTIASGTTTRILYDNAGVLGEYSVIPVALGGTNATSASITAFNNITGYTAAGATGTTSTNIVFSTSPTLVTPVLGVATATSVNGLIITTTTGTFTLTNAKTLTVSDSTTLATSAITLGNGKILTLSNTLTLAGTDSTTMTFPSTTATIARTDAAQTFTGTQTFSQIVTTSNAITASANAATVPITSRISTVTNNSAATLTITVTTTSAVDGQLIEVRILDFSGVAQTITWVNTESSNVTIPTTSNGSTTLPLSIQLQFNSLTTKWRCVGFS